MAKNTAVDVDEAKTHLLDLLDRVAAGEEVTITEAGKPVARLVPVNVPSRRPLGMDAGRDIYIASDFDAPLPDDILADFGNGNLES